MTSSTSTHGTDTNAISTYLNGNANINTTLDSLCQHVENNYQSTGDANAVQDALWILWHSFQTTARQIPYNDQRQQSLVDLIVALANRPTLEHTGQPCIVSDMTVWKDLPIFGWEWRDAWNFNPSTNIDSTALAQWLNLNAWTCRITATSQELSVPALDFSLYGIWTIREGLEVSQKPSEGAVEAAAVWLVLGAQTLYELSRQGKTFQGKMGAPGSLFHDRNWTGYSTERWDAWADRLTTVVDVMSSEQAAKLVFQAMDAMAACS